MLQGKHLSSDFRDTVTNIANAHAVDRDSIDDAVDAAWAELEASRHAADMAAQGLPKTPPAASRAAAQDHR